MDKNVSFLKIVSLYAPQKKESHTILELHEGE